MRSDSEVDGAATASGAKQGTTPGTAVELHPGMALGRRFTVRRPFSARSRDGCRFATFELHEGDLKLRAYAWERECQGFHLPRHGERVYAAGRIRWRNNRFELVCRELLVEDVSHRIRWARERLREILRHLEPTLAELVRRVFTDPRIGPAFLVAPASLNHHHAYSGGLLVHSAETAWSVHRWGERLPERGLATVAALFHDIGKVRTLTGAMTITTLGRQVRHEALTLEVLAPHLAWLDHEWPAGAIVLRHLLTAPARREEPSPAFAALELLRTADRIGAHCAPQSLSEAAARHLD